MVQFPEEEKKLYVPHLYRVFRRLLGQGMVYPIILFYFVSSHERNSPSILYHGGYYL